MFGFEITPLGRETLEKSGFKQDLDNALEAMNSVAEIDNGFVQENIWSTDAEKWTEAERKINRGHITRSLGISSSQTSIPIHKAIFAYALSELRTKEEKESRTANSWRHKEYKTRITNAGGELTLVERANLSSIYPWIFLTEGNRRVRTLCADWGSWQHFLSIILKYAEKTEKTNIPEIKSYGELLEQRHFGEHPDKENFRAEENLDIVLTDSRDIPSGNGIPKKNHGGTYPAYLFNGTLCFGETFTDKTQKRFEARRRGNSVGTYRGNEVYQNIRFNPTELSHLLKATYKLYARVEVEVPMILDAFLKRETVTVSS